MAIDRDVLRTKAYADSGPLMRRVGLYAHRQPRSELVELVASHVPERPEGPVVDVGCGPGLFLAALARRGTEVIGFDLSFGMAAEAARRRTGEPDDPTGVADAEHLPMADGSAGAVLLLHMLYHVPDPARAIAEARRIVRGDGPVIVVTNAPENLRGLRAAASAIIEAHGGAGWWAAERHFDTDVAAEVLPAHFASVEVVPSVGEIVLTDPAPLVAYAESSRALREPGLPPGLTWEHLMSELAASIASTIAHEGAWRTPSACALFACRS